MQEIRKPCVKLPLCIGRVKAERYSVPTLEVNLPRLLDLSPQRSVTYWIKTLTEYPHVGWVRRRADILCLKSIDAAKVLFINYRDDAIKLQ